MIVEPWYLNKAVWLNSFLTLSGILTLVSEAVTQTPQLTVPGVLMLVVGSIGLVIRIWFTDTITPQSAAKLAAKLGTSIPNVLTEVQKKE